MVYIDTQHSAILGVAVVVPMCRGFGVYYRSQLCCCGWLYYRQL